MEVLNIISIQELFYHSLIIVFVLFLLKGMFKLVAWSRKMPKAAFVFLAIFPLVSLFPIPPQEIKKLERIKQEQVKNEDESGEPPREELES